MCSKTHYDTYLFIVEKEAKKVRLSLIENFPFLPIKIIDNVINETIWYTMTGCQVTRYYLDNFYEIALKKIEKQKEDINNVIEILLLNYNNKSLNKQTNSDLAKGISNISFEILKIVLQSTQKIWTQVD